LEAHTGPEDAPERIIALAVVSTVEQAGDGEDGRISVEDILDVEVSLGRRIAYQELVADRAVQEDLYGLLSRLSCGHLQTNAAAGHHMLASM